MTGKTNTWIEQHDKHAEERAQSMEKKFDKIFVWLEKLPCESVKTSHRNLNVRINWLYGLAGGTFVTVLAHFILK